MKPENFFCFDNKVVLVTGASSGIGAASAIHFAKYGAEVSLTGRNLANLKKVAENCEKYGKQPLFIQGDVTIANDLERIISETISAFGRLDILVNNAGIFEISSFETADLEQFDRIINTNLRAVFQLTKLAQPLLLASKGNIINISSLSGMRSFNEILLYSTFKAALNQFTRCISLELAPKGVRVNAIAPGVILTDLYNKAGLSEEQINRFVEVQTPNHPIKRLGTTEDCADLILYLASDKAAFITGEIVSIDGGFKNITPKFM